MASNNFLCDQWLENFIKLRQPVEPTEVYRAGKEQGFSRAQIKDSRRWFGKYIDTETDGGRTVWRWYR